MNRAAVVLENAKNEIMQAWVQKVRAELPAPNKTTDPVLRDHLPLLLDDIIQIMKKYENFRFDSEMESFDEMLDSSTGHGRHRSSSSGYDVAQVLKEYIILHRILTQELRSKNVYNAEVGDLLKYVIENSMLYAVVAFNGSLQKIRQKLLGVLAHDIRNPAAVAYSSIGMLEQEDSKERFEKIRGMSKKSIKRAIDLLENLLETVSVEAGEGLTLHFSERDLLEYIRSLYGEATEIYSNQIILKCGKDSINGVFDGAMIRRVLENIINNAVKYGERDTPVTIAVEDTPEKVAISVHNHGNPIPEQEQQEIFEFLNTANGKSLRNMKSWGMGLSLVKAVAKAHGGSLELESNQENGTTFTLILDKYENKPGKLKSALNFTAENQWSKEMES